MSYYHIAKSQKSWRDVLPGRTRETRQGRGRVGKEDQTKMRAELIAKLKILLCTPHTFHQIQCAIRPPAYETDLRAALKEMGAVRNGRIYTLKDEQ